MALLAGCDSGSSGGATSSGVSPDCAKALRVEIPDGAKTTALVMDNTASTVNGDLPHVVTSALKKAQAQGNRLTLITVAGAGQPPEVVRTVALEPFPGVDSPAADKARPMVIECVVQWAREDAMLPKTQGSAILDAVALAARQRPELVIVASDGVNNVGQFDVNKLRFAADPPSLADELARAGALAPELNEVPLLWTGLGESNPPLPQPMRTNLTEMWSAVLAKANAKVTFDSQSGTRRAAPTGLPADPVIVPEVDAVSLTCGTQLTIPGPLLFAGESAELGSEADTILREVVKALADQPSWFALIEGHAAAYGTEHGRMEISAARSAVVVQRLVQLGVTESRTLSTGHGSAKPLVDEFCGGVHDAAAAAHNRRVVITIGPRGCER